MHWFWRAILVIAAMAAAGLVSLVTILGLGMTTAGLWGRLFIRNSEEGPQLVFILGVSALTVAVVLSAWAGVAVSRCTDIERRRRERGACVKCGYNLTGNVSGVCPECGERI